MIAAGDVDASVGGVDITNADRSLAVEEGDNRGRRWRGRWKGEEEDPRTVKTSIPSTIHVRRLRGCVVAD